MGNNDLSNLPVYYQCGLFEMTNLHINQNGIGNLYTKMFNEISFLGKIEYPKIKAKGQFYNSVSVILDGVFNNVDRSFEGSIYDLKSKKLKKGFFYVENLLENNFIKKSKKILDGYSISKQIISSDTEESNADFDELKKENFVGVYCGEVKNGTMNGYGRFLTKNFDYFGEFQDYQDLVFIYIDIKKKENF